jgi:hypothetical protein
VVSARNLKLQDFTVASLRATLPSFPSTLTRTLGVDAMVGSMRDGGNPFESIGDLVNGPMVVNDLQVRVPARTVTQAVVAMEKDALRAQGVRDLSVDFAPHGRMSVSGTVHKLIDLPFAVGGSIGNRKDGAIGVQLSSMWAGPIPILGPLRSILTALATGSVSSPGVRPDGLTGLRVDVGRMLPPNVRMESASVSTGRGELAVRGSSPEPMPGDVSGLRAELNATQQSIEALQAAPQDGVITLDPTTGVVTAHNLQTPDFTVDDLRVRLPQFPSVLYQTLAIQPLATASRQGTNPLATLQDVTSGPMVVERMQVRMPSATVTKAAQALEGDSLQAQGVKQFDVDVQPGGKLKVSGRAQRGIELPFTAEGQLGATDGKINVAMTGLRVGIIPLLGPLRTLIMGVALSAAKGPGVQAEGSNSLQFDTAKLLPSNIHMQISSIDTGPGELTLRAGQ